MEVALIKYLNPRQNIVVPNVSWGVGIPYECDLVKLTLSNYATEVEIKTSKADYNRDRKKRHFHDSRLFKYFYYAVPIDIADYVEQNLPSGTGLLVGQYYSDSSDIYIVERVKAKTRNNYIKWTDEKRLHLLHLGTMRIGVLKQDLLNVKRKKGDL